ncbi:MAG TPA: hypothetical protein VNQ90_16950 [Chthoniobacteraceae bacterium]|nr:hypothetical protein [Chthoniobacteraceae bacterium]
MDDNIIKILIPLGSAAVGFFWFLAYKHPITFKAVSAPFFFVFTMASLFSMIVLGSTSYFSEEVDALVYNDELTKLVDRDKRDEVIRLVTSKINKPKSTAIYVGGIAFTGLAFLLFFAWVSASIQKEKDQVDKSEDAAKNAETKV